MKNANFSNNQNLNQNIIFNDIFKNKEKHDLPF